MGRSSERNDEPAVLGWAGLGFDPYALIWFEPCLFEP